MNDDLDYKPVDIAGIRMDQAVLLRERIRQSCLIVSGLILYFTIIIFWSGNRSFSIIWFVATMTMVLVTYAYAVIRAPNGITLDNYRNYLRGHVFVSCVTGSVWSILAAVYLDQSSAINLFIAANIAISITLGGILPSSEYRPSFIGLASCLLVPFSVYWIIVVSGPVKMIGFGLLIYYMFALMMSARAEAGTRESIAARNAAEMTTQLVEKTKAVERASREKTRFLAATSHDLSQPLHAQGFFIQSMRKLLSTPEQISLLDKIEKTWRSQNRLLQGLVDVSRLDSGVIKPKYQVFDLAAVLEQLLMEHGTKLQAKNLKLETHFAPTMLFSDSTLLMRIVGNLLTNAIKFTPNGGKIVLSTRSDPSVIVIELADNGPGIPEADQGRIFEEFVQLSAEDKDRQEGLGLGLSIVKRLTSLLDVEVNLNSKPDEGTRWILRVPNHSSVEYSSDALNAKSAHIPVETLIIVIDDEQDILSAMTPLLTEWGCLVLCAQSGAEALNLLSLTQQRPTLIIADKRLADHESGIEAIRTIRAQSGEVTPAILMTGDLQGFDDVRIDPNTSLMPKPVEPDEIRQAIISAATPK